MEILTSKVSGFEMDYFCFGTGKKTFVILPGLSLKSVMLSAQVIAGAYKMFRDDFTVYVFDRRKDIPDGYSVRDMAADTAAVMKEIGIVKADVFGASQGGMMAQYLAIDYPELVHSIVLGSTCSRLNGIAQDNIAKWISLAEKCDVKALNHDFFEKLYSDAFLEKYADALAFLENEDTPEECRKFALLAKACQNYETYGELEKIKCPVLVLGAKNDKVLTGEASEEMAEKLDCEIYIYEEYGHAAYDEAPDYKDRIMRFFKSI